MTNSRAARGVPAWIAAHEQPWLKEPKEDNFEHAGLQCRICRHPILLHYCGYVGVPKGHPLYGVELDQETPALQEALERLKRARDVEMTFARAVAVLVGEIKPTPQIVLEVHGGITYSGDRVPGEKSDGLWWFGFDCAHAGDFVPKSYFEAPDLFQGTVYRNYEYVRAQAERLADQLAAVARAGPLD